MEWGTLLGVFGIGAIFKTFVDALLSSRKDKAALQYKEKREAYFGLLDALHRAAVEPTHENSKAFALWQTKVSIFGSEDARRAAQGIVDTNSGPRDKREEHFNNLLKAIKEDLTQ